MDQGRWNRIEALLQDALDRPLDERAGFLDQACAGDAEIRREVETLLEHEEQAGSFIETPAAASFGGEPEAESSLIGRTVGHYRVESWIGRGGMGEVYKARDERLPRTAALKMLPIQFTADPNRVRRFEQEAFAASKLNHPNIITIFDIIADDDARFIASEYVEGQTLRQVLTGPGTDSGHLDVPRALDIAIQVARALKVAHTAFIVHRDIKPENIMVRADGVVKVLDFGIAKVNEGVVEAVSQGAAAPVPGPRTASLDTVPGTILGTASYMSPEQAQGEPLDGRTDVFSLGAVLYEMVAGERLPAAAAHPDEPPWPPAGTLDRVPKDLERVIRKALRRNRDERYASAGEMLDDLRAVERRQQNRSSRRVAAVSVLTLLSLAALVGVAALMSRGQVWDEQILRDGHSAAVRQAAFSPDGRLLVSAGEDNQVIVWDSARRERLETLTDHHAWTTSVAFSPDGTLFATGSFDRTVIVWSAARLEKRRALDAPNLVQAVAFSPDGRLLAAACGNNVGEVLATRVWETQRWQVVMELPAGLSYGPVFFSPDSRRLIVAGTVWDAKTGRKLLAAESWNWAAFSPDAARMVSTNGTGEVSFWRLADRGELAGRALVAHPRGHQDYGRSVAFSPDGRLVASGSENIVLWDAVKMTKLARFEHDSIVWGLTFSPDGRALVSTHGDGAMLVWDVAERTRAASFNGHSAAVRAIAFSPDGRRIASGGEDRSIIVWNATSGRKDAVLDGHQTRVIAAAFSPDGRSLVSSDQDDYIVGWDLNSRQPRWRIKGPSADNTCLTMSPDGRLVAARPGVYESGTGRAVFLFRGEMGGTEAAAFSPDGRWLVAVRASNVFLLETATWQIRQRVDTGGLSFVAVAFSPDGRRLVTGNMTGTLTLWDRMPLRPIGTLGQHAARVKSLAFAPDGATLASAGDDAMVALWDVTSRKRIARIGTHISPVYAVAFSPDGRRVASGEHDGTVRVYDRYRTLWGFRLD